MAVQYKEVNFDAKWKYVPQDGVHYKKIFNETMTMNPSVFTNGVHYRKVFAITLALDRGAPL